MEDLITFLVKVLANFLLVIFAIFSSDPEQILTPNNSTLSEFTVSFYDMSMMNWLMFNSFNSMAEAILLILIGKLSKTNQNLSTFIMEILYCRCSTISIFFLFLRQEKFGYIIMVAIAEFLRKHLFFRLYKLNKEILTFMQI